jgi:hypothetical protein
MQTLISIPRLEYHVTNTCNLSCQNCNHYTNVLKGRTKQPQDLDEHLGAWVKYLDIADFNLMGGEPFINRSLLSFCEIARKHLSHSNIVIFTNGLLLSKLPNPDDYGRQLAEHSIQVKVTQHSIQPDYMVELTKSLDVLQSWQKRYGVKFTIKDGVSLWTIRYRDNNDGTISPFNDRQFQKSWEICTCRNSPQLVGDRIYKCPQLAYLPDMKSAKMTTVEFEPYLAYEPISHKDSVEKIELFFAKNFQPETFCGMCPSQTLSISNKKIGLDTNANGVEVSSKSL